LAERRSRIAPVRTVALESLDDLKAFRSALTKRVTMPRVRIALNLGELRETQRHAHEQQINRLLGTRGYLEATVGALLFLSLAVAFPLNPAGPGSAAGIAAWVAQGMLCFGMGGAAGMLAGLAWAQQRLRGLCERIEAQASARR
jgi:hypothetical protein